MEDFTILESLPHIGEKMFGNLTIEDLFHCQLVCKAWNLVLTNPMFWLKKLKNLGQSKEITQKWMELIQRSNELQVHKEAISKCLKAIFVSINTRNKTFQLDKPPIPIAIQFGVVEVLELLAEVNEDFNQQILETIVGLQLDQRKPPLHYVIQDKNHKNKLEILKFLAFKCNPNLKDCHQRTALHLAIEKRWIEAVKFLVPLTDDLAEHKTILYTSVIREIIAREKIRRSQAQPRTQAQQGTQPETQLADQSGTQRHQQIQLLTQPQMTQSQASQPQPSQSVKKKKGKKKSSKKKDQQTQKGTQQPGTQTHHQIQPLTSSSLCVAMSNAYISPQTSQPQTAQLGPQFVRQTGTQPKSRRGQAHAQTQQDTQFVSQSGTQPQTQLRTQQETQFVSQSGTQPQTQPQTQQGTQVVSQSGTQLKSRRDQGQPVTQPHTQQEIQFVNQSGTQPKTTTTHQSVQSQMTQSQTPQLQGAQPQPSQPIKKKEKKKKCKKKENIRFLTALGITAWH